MSDSNEIALQPPLHALILDVPTRLVLDYTCKNGVKVLVYIAHYKRSTGSFTVYGRIQITRILVIADSAIHFANSMSQAVYPVSPRPGPEANVSAELIVSGCPPSQATISNRSLLQTSQTFVAQQNYSLINMHIQHNKCVNVYAIIVSHAIVQSKANAFSWNKITL